MKFLKIKIICVTLALASTGIGCGTSSTGQSTTSSILENANEIFTALSLSNVDGKGSGNLVFQFFTDAQFAGNPAFTISTPFDLTGKTGSVEQTYSFLDLTRGNYYLRAFFDENENGSLDTGELNGNYGISGAARKLKVSKANRQAIVISLQ